jgi:hypothetical protein
MNRKINRRRFIAQAAGSAALPVLLRSAWSQNDGTRRATVKISSAETDRRIPENFTGLSYELAQLTEPNFFSAHNSGLVALFKRLSSRGLLRIGGNTSEFCWLRVSPSTAAPKLHIPSGDIAANWMPHRLFEIPSESIDALAAFLIATGWSVIYGLNFGNSSPERAATEAAYVADRLGARLAFFQIGNEPDFYQDASNGTRPRGWGFSDYLREWSDFANAITAKVPHARFGAPDIGSSSDWVSRFGAEMAPKLGNRLIALSAHYYAEGPPDSPRVTTARLLAGDPNVTASTKTIVQVATEHGLQYPHDGRELLLPGREARHERRICFGNMGGKLYASFGEPRLCGREPAWRRQPFPLGESRRSQPWPEDCDQRRTGAERVLHTYREREGTIAFTAPNFLWHVACPAICGSTPAGLRARGRFEFVCLRCSARACSNAGAVQ